MKSILDPSFRYTASFNTDLQKTFARIRREQQQDAERPAFVTVNSPWQARVHRQKDSDGLVMKHVSCLDLR